VRAAVLVGDNADDVSDLPATPARCALALATARCRSLGPQVHMSDGLHSLGSPLSFPANASRNPFTSPSSCPAVHGGLQLLSIGILETDPSEARVARCDACVKRRRPCSKCFTGGRKEQRYCALRVCCAEAGGDWCAGMRRRLTSCWLAKMFRLILSRLYCSKLFPRRRCDYECCF
jgi:hypothetical protein